MNTIRLARFMTAVLGGTLVCWGLFWVAINLTSGLPIRWMSLGLVLLGVVGVTWAVFFPRLIKKRR